MGRKVINPYPYVYEATKNGESLLSLCCGIGLELAGLNTPNVTAVDLHDLYLNEVRARCPQAKTVQADALAYAKAQLDGSVDVISLIDGLEHMPKKDGLELIKEMKRVGRKILLFVPQGRAEDGYLKNEPHNAWGVTGGDDFQKHLSGWTQTELEGLGFKLVAKTDDTSQHGEPYTALMMEL